MKKIKKNLVFSLMISLIIINPSTQASQNLLKSTEEDSEKKDYFRGWASKPSSAVDYLVEFSLPNDCEILMQEIDKMTIDDARSVFGTMNQKTFQNLQLLSQFLDDHNITSAQDTLDIRQSTYESKKDSLEEKMVNLKNHIKVLTMLLLSQSNNEKYENQLIDLKQRKLKTFKNLLIRYYERGDRLRFKYVIKQAYLVYPGIKDTLLDPSNHEIYKHMRFDPQEIIGDPEYQQSWIPFKCKSENNFQSAYPYNSTQFNHKPQDDNNTVNSQKDFVSFQGNPEDFI